MGILTNLLTYKNQIKVTKRKFIEVNMYFNFRNVWRDDDKEEM